MRQRFKKYPLMVLTCILFLTVGALAIAGLRDRTSNIELYGAKTLPGHYMLFPEILDPGGTPGTDYGYFYAKDNGGLTQPYWEDSAGTVTNLISSSATATDFALTADADAGDKDIKSIDELEFYDAGLVIDGGADGVLLISSDGTLQIATADWDISTTGTITNASISADQVSAAALTLGNNYVSIGTDPADAGAIRLANDADIFFEADATGTDISAISVDSSEIVQIGESGASGVTITPNTTITGTLTVGSTLYQSAVAPAAGNLTVNAAGAGTISVGNASTGAITITGGGVNIGDGATDTLTITGFVDSDVMLDDSVTDSPKMIFKDSDGEQAEIYQDQASDDLEVECNDASDSLAILVGNLSSGTPANDVISLNGDDLFVADDAEINGTLVVDVDGGGLDVNEDVDIDFDATDEEMVISTSAEVGGAGFPVVKIDSSDSDHTVQGFLLELTHSADDGDVDADFMVLSDSGGDLVTFSEGGTTLWTVDPASLLKIDADTTANTGTAGVLDIDAQSATNTHKAVSVTYQLETGATQAYGLYVDLNDDSGGAEFFDAMYFTNSAGTNATTRALVVANDVDDAIVHTVGAAAQSLVIDAAATINTGAAGIFDITAIMSTDVASVINIDVESEAGGAGEFVHGIYISMDDDADNVDNEIHGITVTGDGTNGTGLQHGIVVLGANIDAGLQLDTGYLRVGTGATADQTLGAADNAFIEGTLEVDGNIYPDGNITGDGATELVGTIADIVVSSGGTHAVTAAMSGTIFYNDQACEFDLPADPTGCRFTFIVHNASNLDLDPNGTDRFPSPISDTNGDYLRSSTIGDSITIVGLDASTWYIENTYPAATDWVEE